VCATFGPRGIQGVCGHPVIETALVELARATGEQRYLDQAALFVERRGQGTLSEGEFGRAYHQDDLPVREATVLRGHAVRALYLASGAVDVAVETGDEELLAAVVRQWETAVARRTYLTGGMGSHHRDEAFGDDFVLPPDRAYSETCAGVASVMLSWRLLLATGEPRFADLAERTLFNVVATSPAEDGRSFFYVNTLHRRRRGAVITTGAVALTVRTDYPSDGRVTVRIERSPDHPWTLSLRVPAWAEGGPAWLVEPDGRRRSVVPGTAEVTRVFRPGDEIRLDLPVRPRWLGPDPRIDAIRGTAAVQRGPLVYCAESVDLPEGQDVDAVRVDPSAPPEGRADGSVVVAGETTRQRDAPWPYRADGAPPPAGDPTGIVLVPYHRWANRGPSTMRVWLPTADSAT
jgi:DUF1680 family protein